MLEFLRGELCAKGPNSATVSVGGVGYRVLIPLSTFEVLPECGQEVKLWAHLHVREDGWKLFGFASRPERRLFRLLLGVNRVGPALALQVLSSCSLEQFRRYIAERDAEALAAMVKGIGQKTARRLIVELAPALEEVEGVLPPPAGGRAARDTEDALVSLGLSRNSARRAVRSALRECGSEVGPDELLKAALARQKD